MQPFFVMKKISIGDKIKIETPKGETLKSSFVVRHGSGLFDFLYDTPVYELPLTSFKPFVIINGEPYPYLFSLFEEILESNSKIFLETSRLDVLITLSNLADELDKKTLIYTSKSSELPKTLSENRKSFASNVKEFDVIIVYKELFSDSTVHNDIANEVINFRKNDYKISSNIFTFLESDALTRAFASFVDKKVVKFFINNCAVVDEESRISGYKIFEKVEEKIKYLILDDFDNEIYDLDNDQLLFFRKFKSLGYLSKFSDIRNMKIDDKNLFSYAKSYEFVVKDSFTNNEIVNYKITS